jgi:cobalamin biosynthesis protein CbiD
MIQPQKNQQRGIKKHFIAAAAAAAAAALCLCTHARSHIWFL